MEKYKSGWTGRARRCKVRIDNSSNEKQGVGESDAGLHIEVS